LRRSPDGGKVEAVRADEQAALPSPPARRTGYVGKHTSPPPRTLWRQRNFLLLWSGHTVSEMGSAITQLALPLTAVVVLGASTLQVGLLTSAGTAAFALIALPAGAIVALLGVRTTLWIAFVGSWAAGWWVFFSPLRRMRDILEVHGTPGGDIPGQSGRELPDGAGAPLGH
jgi:Na+/melibiose symporter-like transporter